MHGIPENIRQEAGPSFNTTAQQQSYANISPQQHKHHEDTNSEKIRSMKRMIIINNHIRRKMDQGRT